MKIVNVIDIFQPERGYLSHILGKYMRRLGHEYIILTTDLIKQDGFYDNWDFEELDKEYTVPTGVEIIRIHCKKYISGRAIWTFRKYKAILAKLKPDLIYVSGNDTYIGIISTLFWERLPAPLIMDSHMLEMASANRFRKQFRWAYKRFITPIIKKNHIPVIRVQDDSFVSDAYNIPLELAPYISFGSDITLFYPDKEVSRSFRKELDIPESAFVVTYTGKLDKSKGGKLLANAFKKKFLTDKEIVLIAVGNTAGEYGEEVENLFSISENRIIRYPTQKYKELPKFYQIADLVVFSKECSLSFFDAQACGAPVLSEDNNINVERCSHGNGWNFRAGDIDDYRKKLTMIFEMNPIELEAVRTNAYKYVKNNFDYRQISKEYEVLFEKTAFGNQTERKWLM